MLFLHLALVKLSENFNFKPDNISIINNLNSKDNFITESLTLYKANTLNFLIDFIFMILLVFIGECLVKVFNDRKKLFRWIEGFVINPFKFQSMFKKNPNIFKKLNVPTNQDKNYLLKYRTYSSQCVESLLQSCVDNTHINTKIDVNESIDKKPFNYRTLLCKFFLVNACTRGDDCAYSHDTSVFPCKAHFVRHNCKRKNCLFSHDPNTLDKLDESVEENDTIKVDSPFF